jgi:glutamate--cysteine ligase catalytic subunit
VNPEHVKMLQDTAKIDQRLAHHIASLFVRDPIPTFDYEHDKDFDNSAHTGHFENLQSTNWCSLRFKPPPSLTSTIGWRLEFRTMDIQLTDYENTALIVALTMVLNVFNHFDVNFIMPISKIDENMDRAHLREAASK